MVKSCDSALALGELLASASTPRAGSIMDVKTQGSRSGKALGIGELLASSCSASALGIGELLASSCSASALLD